MSTYERIEPPSAALEDDLDLSFEDQSDDEQNPRTSTEVRRLDQRIIEDDEEAEKLLIEQRNTPKRKGLFGHRNDGHKASGADGSGRRMNEKRNNRGGNRNGSGETLYEMEEGAQRTSGESSGHSSDVDLQRLLGTQQSLQVGPNVRIIIIRC